MRRLGKILLTAVLAVLALAAVLVGLFFLSINTSVDVPEHSSFEIDLRVVREMAQAPEDSLPVHVNNTLIAKSEYIRGQVISGGGLDPYIFHFSTFQLVYADGSSIIIDAAHDKNLHDMAASGQPYDQDEYDRMQTALRSASLILATHEHLDHVGGVLTSRHFDEINDKMLLSTKQREGLLDDDDSMELIPEGRISAVPTLEYDKYSAVAPGVVLIDAPGHTSGGQIIFVRLHDGKEYMFLGDIVWSADNLRTLTSRPYFSTILGSEDGAQVANQVRTLHDLMNETAIHLIVAHDGDQRQADLERGVYREGFQ